jgi:hypothetical protein
MDSTADPRRAASILEGLRAEAIRRFGPERAEAIRPALEQTAEELALIAAFPLDREEEPAFFLHREA